jgi:NADPH:quinone reductase-like Zn-dependent oxidoreductase
VQLTQRARRAIGQELDMVADLVGQGTLAASLLVMREGGRAGSIVELAGDLVQANPAHTLSTPFCHPFQDPVTGLGMA